MSDLFAMSDPTADAKLAAAAENSVDSLADVEAPMFRGTGHGLLSGVMRGGAKTGLGLGFLLAPFASAPAPSYLTGSGSFQKVAESPELADPVFQAVDETAGNAVDYWTPRANEVGRVGQVLGGLGEVVLPLAATAGAPGLLVAGQTAAGGKELVDQGVDAGTAGAAAALEGAASYAGLKVPIAGSTLASRIGTGIAGNVALGSGSREAEKLLLESQGYDQQAQGFTTDLASVSTDALLGALFGVTHHTLSPRINPKLTPAAVDAVLTARNAKSFQEETAPGATTSVGASAAHQSAMEATLEQLSGGKPVDVGDVVARHDGAQFAPAGKVEQSAELAQMVEDASPHDAPRAPVPSLIERAPNLSEADRAIESRFAETIQRDVASQVEAYKAIPETEGGNVINTDIVRELSPDYLADRSKAAAVHEPASFLTKEIYRRKLAEAAPGGEVIFAGGGAGSGKSSGLKLLGVKDQIVYDGTLSKFASATKVIDQALAADQKARIVFTYRDPVEAFKNGVLPRSMREEKKFGTGRTVPLDAFEHGHRGARETVSQLMDHYKGDERVRFEVIDNSRGQRDARIVDFDELPARDYNAVRGSTERILEEARRSGSISEAVYRGIRGGAPEVGPQRHRPADRGQPEPQRAEQGPNSVAAPPKGGINDTPELASLRQLAAERPDAVVYSGSDADGQPIKSTVAEEYARIQRDYEREIQDTKAYEAAITCYLGHGA
jgi:hypothetical protein